MKKFFALLTAVALVSAASLAQAGTVRLGGDVDGDAGAKTGGGVINVIIDLDPGSTLSAGGGIDFAVETSAPGVVEFTSAAIGAGNWDLKTAVVSNGGQRVQMNTTALFQTGLPEGAQNQVIATINYNVLNAAGNTALNYVIPPVAGIVDGTHPTDPDRTSAYNFVPGALTFGTVVPEPGTLALASLSMIGLVLRRRNG